MGDLPFRGVRPTWTLDQVEGIRRPLLRQIAETTPLLLRRSRRKWGLLVLGAVVLVAGGVSMIFSHGGLTMVVGWVAVIFFGLSGIVAVAQLFMNSYLMLTPE